LVPERTGQQQGRVDHDRGVDGVDAVGLMCDGGIPVHVARPLRFRHSQDRWTDQQVRKQILSPLDDNLGATTTTPHFRPPDGWTGHRFEMDNGDLALFAYDDDEAYWLGNTETPSSLWRTDKRDWEDVPYEIHRWAQRELLADLEVEAPWTAEYPHVAWFFLPVLMSKDGRYTTREFLHEHACGFPDADSDDALAFLERVLDTGVLDDDRHVMAGKLGTSEYLDLTRMASAVAEYVAAWILTEAGYEVVPEIDVAGGYSLDYRAIAPDGSSNLVEVTRPLPPQDRSANNPVTAIRETAQTKTTGQLEAHGGGVTLFVDCSSYHDDQWAAVRGERPDVHHRPALVYRTRPDGSVEGYTKGSVPLDLAAVVDVVARD
jgi:hypothetical protein